MTVLRKRHWYQVRLRTVLLLVAALIAIGLLIPATQRAKEPNERAYQEWKRATGRDRLDAGADNLPVE